MEIKAHLKNAHIGAFKTRLVSSLIKGKDINSALSTLSFTQKKAAFLIKGLLQSAVANALEKSVVDIDNLYIKSITVNQARKLKRFQPRAQGRAFPIAKQRSHISLVLDEKK